jgi:hypothetical protein
VLEVAHRAGDVATRVGQEDELADARDLGPRHQHVAAVALGGDGARAGVRDRERDLEPRVTDEGAAALDGADRWAGVGGAPEPREGLVKRQPNRAS